MKFLITIVFAIFISYCFADLKSDLLNRAAELEASAKNLTDRLKAQNKTELTRRINEQVVKIDAVVVDIKNTTDDSRLRLDEQQLSVIEITLNNEIRRLEGLLATADTLINDAVTLKKFVVDEVAKLLAITGPNAARAHEVAANLQKEQTRIDTIVTQIKAAQIENQLQVLDRELTQLEDRVTNELRRLGEIVTSTAAPWWHFW